MSSRQAAATNLATLNYRRARRKANSTLCVCGRWGTAALLRPHLPTSPHYVLVRRELFHPHRSARMNALGGDADLRAHAELSAVGELRGSVVQHDGAVHTLEESLRGGGVCGDDAVGVRRA